MPSFSKSRSTSTGRTLSGSLLAYVGSYPPCAVSWSASDSLSKLEISYLPYLEAEDDSIWSGLCLGTIPPEVTKAIFAFVISLTAGFGATLSILALDTQFQTLHL